MRDQLAVVETRDLVINKRIWLSYHRFAFHTVEPGLVIERYFFSRCRMDGKCNRQDCRIGEPHGEEYYYDEIIRKITTAVLSVVLLSSRAEWSVVIWQSGGK